MAEPRGIDFSGPRPDRLRPIEARLPDWLWGDKGRHTRKRDEQRVIILRTVHFEAMQFIVFLCTMLSLEIEARQEGRSVPSLAQLLPGGLGLPDRDNIQSTIDSATTDGLRQARQLLSDFARPAVVRFWFSRQTLEQLKLRKRGLFTGSKEFSNRMKIRIPHR